MHDNYRSKRKDHRLALRNFLNHLEADRVNKLCVVKGALITEENDIRDMLADHSEVPGTPTVSLNFDNEFSNSISTHIQNIFQNCINDPT